MSQAPARRPGEPSPGLVLRRQVALGDPVDVEVRASDIRDGAGATRPATPFAAGADVAFAYGGLAANSRLPAMLGGERWKQRWTASLNGKFAPAFLLRDTSHILVQGRQIWELFDAGGKKIKDQRVANSCIYLDSRSGLFYFANQAAFLEARTLEAGQLRFSLALRFDAVFARVLVGRFGRRIVSVGVDQPRRSATPAPPDTAVIEFSEMGDRIELNSAGLVSSLTRAEALHLKTATVEAAANGDHLYFAVPGYLFRTTTDLQVEAAFSGSFEPRMLSVDEAGYMYLIAGTSGGAELWVVSPEGKRTARFFIAQDRGEPVGPPIVGYDHRIYLLTRSQAIALDPSGAVLWERPTGGAAAGAGITGDGRLLVSVGSELAVFEPDGTRHVLFTAGEPLLTPPILTSSGDLLAASAAKLYCLVADTRQ